MDASLSQLRAEGYEVLPEDVARLSPLGFKHVNMLGRYAFTLPDTVARRAPTSARPEGRRHRRGMSKGLCRFSAPLLLRPLIVAKVDRLARSKGFLERILESGVDVRF